MPRPGARRFALAALICGSWWSLGCHEVVEPGECALPEILSSEIRPNPDNVLSAIAATRLRGADSVAVLFRRTGDALDTSTPSAVAQDDSAVVPLLGLAEQTQYSVRLVAFNRCGTQLDHAVAFTTLALPSDLPHYTASGSDPSPGFIAFAAGAYGIVIDNTGRIVWYHRFPTGPGLNFQPQPNGRYTSRPGSLPGEIGHWTEVDPLGNTTRTLGCGRGLQPRLHDMIAEPDGSYWMLCDENRTLDLSNIGGSQQALVLGTGVQHIGSSGNVLFDWSPFDHMAVDIQSLEPADFAGGSVNWTHGNALDLDADGNLLLSFRNQNEIIKIDTRSGAVMWRMGGAQNQFTFDNTASPAFRHQHGVRSLGAGKLQLLDNLGDPSGSRTEQYEYDEARHTVRLSSSHTPLAQTFALTGGTTQRLASGRTLVTFGSGGRVEEFDATGNVVWKIDGNPGYVFRATRIRSLYRPGVGDPR
jgi:hypothetical protein